MIKTGGDDKPFTEPGFVCFLGKPYPANPVPAHCLQKAKQLAREPTPFPPPVYSATPLIFVCTSIQVTIHIICKRARLYLPAVKMKKQVELIFSFASHLCFSPRCAGQKKTTKKGGENSFSSKEEKEKEEKTKEKRKKQLSEAEKHLMIENAGKSDFCLWESASEPDPAESSVYARLSSHHMHPFHTPHTP